MKRILFIQKKPISDKADFKQQMHNGWVEDCRSLFEIKTWGLGYNDSCNLKGLQSVINSFKPDCIYMTKRKNYVNWLPDLTNIKVPKIFVEVDTYKYNLTDPWYKQFDRLLCRSPFWYETFVNRPEKTISESVQKRIIEWQKIPTFKWSVPEKSFGSKKRHRKGIYFMGAVHRRGYTERKMMYKTTRKKVIFCKFLNDEYWNILHNASATLCPTESNYGNFVPAKLFEFLAAGTAVITNCDLKRYGAPELDLCVIEYKTLMDLRQNLLKHNFPKYYCNAVQIMRKRHSHKVRYASLFK